MRAESETVADLITVGNEVEERESGGLCGLK